MRTTTQWCIAGAVLIARLAGCAEDGDVIGRGATGATGGSGGSSGGTVSGSGGAGTGGSGGIGSDVCHENGECPAGHVCVFETGACEPASPVTCAPTPSTAGTQALGAACGIVDNGSFTQEYPCAPGLVCVTTAFSLDPATGEYGPAVASVQSKLRGKCTDACDPCVDTCSSGTCVALQAGGGFCAPGPLIGEGETCAVLKETVAWCEAGTMCWYAGAAQTACSRYCTPDDPMFWDFGAVNVYAASADCGLHQVCTPVQVASNNDVWVCQTGDLQPTGGSCNNPDTPAMKCAWPDGCVNGYSPELGAVPATCSLVNNPDPEVCPSCPVGTVCRFAGDGSTNTRAACVAPGAIGVFGYCGEDVDCAAPLACKVHATAGKICQP